MPANLQFLNENQRRAVEFGDGPLLVLAGPGSGKTHVLTIRVAHLVEQWQNNTVLALTFTQKATTEMRDRVSLQLHGDVDRVRLCTFHSFALDLLRQHASHIGLRPDFTLLAQDVDRLEVLREAVANLEGPNPDMPRDERQRLALLDRLFNGAYDGESGPRLLAREPEWIPDLFTSYCDRLVQGNRMDFPRLLHFSRKLLNIRPGIRQLTHLTWSHVCVDEFQDTNRSQYELLKLIVNDHKRNLFVVADDDQIVYRWNGASPRQLNTLIRDYEMTTIQLPESYRCPKRIVVLANNLIRQNRDRIPDKLLLESSPALSTSAGKIRCRVFPNTEVETASVARNIKNRSLRPSTCVVLARNRKLVDRVAEALRAENLEPHVVRRKDDWEVGVVRVMFIALQLANSPHDGELLRRLCVDWERLTTHSVEVESVVGGAALVGGDFLRAWVEATQAEASGRDADLVEEISSHLVDRRDFPGVVERFLSTGTNPWRNEADHTLAEELQTWRALHEQFVDGHQELTLHAYLDFFALASKTPAPGPNAIRCATIHQAKGLQFDHVYLIGLTKDILPSYYAIKAGQASKEMEEERRACFVAITKARKSLTLTGARRYNHFPKGESQFLREMGIRLQGPTS